jgi:hypothetical protein
LAERFHQHPNTFLDLPVSEVWTHVRHTVELIEMQNKARRDREEERNG